MSFDAGEWRISFGPIVWEMRENYRESRRTGITYIQ